MTVGTFITTATKELTDAGIETARLDCLVLLEDVLITDRAHLLAHPEIELTDVQEEQLAQAIQKRIRHIPLAYIRGKVMFYGREFAVNEHVLVPRPETESIIDLLKQLSLPQGTPIADIGTGSGCVGITAALEMPTTSVTLYDVDADALAVAQANAKQLQANVACAPINVLEELPSGYNVIVTNLPYVPESYPVNRAATFEPKIALFSGPDGLDHYRAFWKHIGSMPEKPQYVLAESLPSQHHALARLARVSGYALEKTDDFIQLFSL